ncbi:MAG: 6-phosphofructokinase [Candidatus Acidiferrales bacterium]|jgi:6-phosphofructokinase 1
MTQPKRIGILTGGGDVPGLNAVIKSVVYQTTSEGCEVIGIRRGWEGLTHLKPGPEPDPDYILPLNRENTRNVDRDGGTFLHTSRTNALKMKRSNLPPHISAERLKAMATGPDTFNFTPVVIENIERLGLHCLVAIGGDDTLSFAKTLETNGVRVLGIPKTMDNDVRGTEYCVGFSTAITRANEIITRQRTSLGSHERIGVFRMFGRDAGYTALFSAYVTGGRCVIPEVEFDLEGLVQTVAEDKQKNPSRYSFVIASEGAVWKGHSISEYGEADAFGHKKKVDIGQALGEEIRKRTGNEIMVADLTYELRSGDPDSTDHIVAITFGNVAADLIREGIFGRLVALQGGKYTHVPIPDPKLGPRKLDVEKLYNVARFRPHYSGKLGSSMLINTEIS